jgi:DHA2 family multidrug resistance protein
MRNIGGSVGIATVTTLLARRSQVHQNFLAGNITADAQVAASTVSGLAAHLAASGFDAWDAHRAALGALYRMVEQQASLLAYSDDFAVLGYLTLFSVPLVLMFQRVGRH